MQCYAFSVCLKSHFKSHNSKTSYSNIYDDQAGTFSSKILTLKYSSRFVRSVLIFVASFSSAFLLLLLLLRIKSNAHMFE